MEHYEAARGECKRHYAFQAARYGSLTRQSADGMLRVNVVVTKPDKE